MHIVIEFYRTRDRDNAHAVFGRETAEAADLDDAMEIARPLSQIAQHAATTRRHDDYRWGRPGALCRRARSRRAE